MQLVYICSGRLEEFFKYTKIYDLDLLLNIMEKIIWQQSLKLALTFVELLDLIRAFIFLTIVLKALKYAKIYDLDLWPNNLMQHVLLFNYWT